MGFFAIMNPIANTPVFLGLTAEDDPATQRKIAARALIVSFVIILVPATAGKVIFQSLRDNAACVSNHGRCSRCACGLPHAAGW